MSWYWYTTPLIDCTGESAFLYYHLLVCDGIAEYGKVERDSDDWVKLPPKHRFLVSAFLDIDDYSYKALTNEELILELL